jgi:hypothetical protein
MKVVTALLILMQVITALGVVLVGIFAFAGNGGRAPGQDASSPGDKEKPGKRSRRRK